MDTIPVTPNLDLSLAQVPPSDGHYHEVQFYSDDAFLADVLARFIAQALSAGDVALVIATEEHRSGLAQRLNDRRIDFDAEVQNSRIVALDGRATLSQIMVHGTVDQGQFTKIVSSALAQARRRSARTGSRVAVFGELVALLWAQGKLQEAIRLEEMWNQLARIEPFYLLCAYPLRGFNRETHIAPFLEVCAQHSRVVPSETYLELTTPEERLRSVAFLQQKSQALESEMALRRSDQIFRLFVEAVEDYAIFTVDSEGYIQSWNAGAERIKGYKPSEILGKHFSVFYPKAEVRAGKPGFDLETAARLGRFEDEGWRVRRDGSTFWANVVVTPVKDEDGKVIGFGKVTRDFTERMNAQVALQKEIAERRKAQHLLCDSEKSLRQLSLHLLRTQDEERRRIGRDLHDSLGQSLVVLKMKLDSLALPSELPHDLVDDITRCARLVDDSIVELRTIAYLLYPPMLEEMGLKSAVPWYLDGFSSRSGVATTFEIDPNVQRLPRDAELALFRVLQESLTNVHRHSKGEGVQIRLLMRGHSVVLEVRDNGTGLPTGVWQQADPVSNGQTSMGLRSMTERMRELGGTLELTSTQEGTTVTASVPLDLSSIAAID